MAENNETQVINEQEQVEDLVEKAEEEDVIEIKTQRDVFETELGYYKYSRGKNRELKCVSNVILNAIAMIESEDEWYFLCEAKSSSGVIREIAISRNDFRSGEALKRVLSRYRLEYYGDSKDTTQILGILTDQNPPIQKGISKHGLYLYKSQWYYVDSTDVLSLHDPHPQVVAVGHKSGLPKMSNILEQPDLTEEHLHEIAEYLYRFNHLSVVFPILGYLGYCFLKPRIQHYVGNRNPFLFFQGEPGSGKSETILRIIYPLFSSLTPLVNIANATEFAGAVECGYSNMNPVALDEWKTAVVSKPKKTMMEQMLLATFNQTSLKRGRGSGKICHFRYTTPVIIAGEMKIESPSLYQRMIEVFFSINRRNGSKENFLKLTGMPLGSLGKELLKHTLMLDDDHLQTQFNILRDAVDGEIEDRIRDNAALLRMGLWLIIDYFKMNNIDTQNYKNGYEVIDAVFKDMVMASQITNVDRTLQDFATMANLGILIRNNEYDIKEGILRLKIAGVYDKYERWNKGNRATAECIGKHSFFQQLEDKPYFIKKMTTRIGNTPCNAVHIDLKQIPASVDIEFFRDLDREENRTFFNEGGDEPWSDDTPPEYKMTPQELANHIEGRKVYNKDGTPSLTTHLMDILYCDKPMELEFIVDELRSRGLIYEEKDADRIVRLTLRRSEHFAGNDETGYLCPGNGRFWSNYR